MKSAPSSQLLAPFLLALALTFAAVPAHAQSSAPALFDVQQVLVQYVRFGDAQIAATCDLSREGIAAALEKTLSDAGVPAIPVDQAKPPAFDVARIDLVPEVFSFNDGGLDCTSWVDLSAESHENLHIAPVGAPRAVTVDYWRQGLLLESGETQHEQAVEGAFQKLATRFAESYRRAQPPKLPGQ